MNTELYPIRLNVNTGKTTDMSLVEAGDKDEIESVTMQVSKGLAEVKKEIKRTLTALKNFEIPLAKHIQPTRIYSDTVENCETLKSKYELLEIYTDGSEEYEALQAEIDDIPHERVTEWNERLEDETKYHPPELVEEIKAYRLAIKELTEKTQILFDADIIK